jgi:hypothetical protein
MPTLTTRAAPAPDFNAQIPAAQTEKQQVNALRIPRTPNHEPSQVDQALAGANSRARHEVSQRLVDRAKAEVDRGRLLDEILDGLADPNIPDEQAGRVVRLRVGMQRLIAGRLRIAGSATMATSTCWPPATSTCAPLPLHKATCAAQDLLGTASIQR